MAKSLNRADSLGYLGNDIKIKKFRDGTSVGEPKANTIPLYGEKNYP